MSMLAQELIQGLDPDNDAFWQAVVEGRIVLRSCRACGTRFALPLPSCPECGAAEPDEVVSTGAGTLYSWVVIRYAFGDGLAEQVPYVVAAVELDEGARIFGRLEGIAIEDIATDLRVVATFPTGENRPPLVFVPESQEGAS